MQTVRVPMESLYEVILLQLENGGKANLVVTGVSMKPMLTEHRDSVLLAPITAKPGPGDIFLYRRNNGQYVLHRLIRNTDQGYLFCGDNQYTLEHVAPEQLLAVVDSFTREGKRIFLTQSMYRMYVFMCVRLFCMRKCYIKIRRLLGRIHRKTFRRRKRL